MGQDACLYLREIRTIPRRAIRVAYQAKRGIVSSAVIDCDAIDGALAAQLLNGARLDPEGFAAICHRLAGDGAEELMDWLM